PFTGRHYDVTWRNAIPSFFLAEHAVGAMRDDAFGITGFLKNIANTFLFNPVRTYIFGNAHKGLNAARAGLTGEENANSYSESSVENLIFTLGTALGITDA